MAAQLRAGLRGAGQRTIGTARDMGPAGFDNDSGFGLIQAEAALRSLSSVTGITPNPIDLFD